ncbi:MAG: Fimbrial associated sortase [candidate division WS6 bacterium GW2011_GWF2_39_15]|uniref:Fimbrial associated sortase n=1 Tax=candidate division WS6 bacterium GW2011_GWF2_39_15 TaxID=1619100 RepID=A0A0G0QVG0_9BACT|nr:MAG: Fimbrial associated sortase [candidate division WS6 bacterium GW2011_GWF2_39_15]
MYSSRKLPKIIEFFPFPLFLLFSQYMDNMWNTENQEIANSSKKKGRAIIASAIGFVGLIILLSQVFPILGSYISGKLYEVRASFMVKPIPDSHKEFIEGQFAYYNPGKSYFQNLLSAAGNSINNLTYDPVTRQLKEPTIDTAYNKALQLTILGTGISNIRITPNVESYDEKVYNLKLKSGLAHFKGTPIPGDGGNSFIYGHSSVPSFFKNNQNMPEIIFSKLDKVDIGAQVIVKRDGKDLKYIVRRKKIIEATDFSVLKTEGDKETVTMMTCWPLGIPSKRLIVVAERYE